MLKLVCSDLIMADETVKSVYAQLFKMVADRPRIEKLVRPRGFEPLASASAGQRSVR